MATVCMASWSHGITRPSIIAGPAVAAVPSAAPVTAVAVDGVEVGREISAVTVSNGQVAVVWVFKV